MTLTLYPAIDLMGGRCVRLSQGEASQQTVYSDDPVAVARDFEAQGARWIHLVDLDGAFGGGSPNAETVRAIRAAVGLRLELGGGLRGFEEVEAVLAAGIDRAVIGTWAARSPEAMRTLVRAHGARIAAGIDARDGLVSVKGWTELTNLRAEDFARQLAAMGVQTIIATDIATDGMLTGPNVGFLLRLARAAPRVNLVASGGVSSLDDLRRIASLGLASLEGVIVGRAIYAGKMSVRDALSALG